MDIFYKTSQIDKSKTSCLVCFKAISQKLALIDHLNHLSDNKVYHSIKRANLTGKIGQSLNIFDIDNLEAKSLVVIGIGDLKELDESKFKQICQNIYEQINNLQVSDATIAFDDLKLPNRDFMWQLTNAACVFFSQEYKFDDFKTDKSEKPTLKKLYFHSSSRKQQDKCKFAISQGKAIANGMSITKNLANTPGNVCTPDYLAKFSKDLAKSYKKLSCAVLSKHELESLGMRTLLAVGQGSSNPPKLITLKYNGEKSSPPIVLIGKGITFDTGGNSLKPREAMISMKYDMCGAASVLGILSTIAELDLPINVVGIIAAAENMPGGNAIRPDDIIETFSGKTVEILNTDAEGRLVLCDALTYAKRFKPKYVIDIATLTGACIVALGRLHSGLFSNDQELADLLVSAGNEADDRCWQLPISKEYHNLLESNVADMANIGGAEAPSITAACFLAKFADEFKWAHIDIAGSAVVPDKKGKTATGRPVALLTNFLINQIK